MPDQLELIEPNPEPNPEPGQNVGEWLPPAEELRLKSRTQARDIIKNLIEKAVESGYVNCSVATDIFEVSELENEFFARGYRVRLHGYKYIIHWGKV